MKYGGCAPATAYASSDFDEERKQMHYRTLGYTGAVVSTYALGTMTFGSEADEPASHEILDDYIAAGGNFIDTADVYSSGVSEEIIGRWLVDHPTEREQVVVATKGRFPTGDGPNDLGTSRRHLGRALDASLRRLGVEQIDLYQMHAWDAVTPLEETLRFLDDAVRDGKIAYYGFSNFLGWQLTKAVYVARLNNFAPPATLQRPVQPAGARDRVRDRAGRTRCENRPVAMVAAGRRVAYRQVPARRRPNRRHATGRES